MLEVKGGAPYPPLRLAQNVISKHKKTTTPNPNKNLSKNEVNSAFSLKIGKAFFRNLFLILAPLIFNHEKFLFGLFSSRVPFLYVLCQRPYGYLSKGIRKHRKSCFEAEYLYGPYYGDH
jgi:hypothetical protein